MDFAAALTIILVEIGVAVRGYLKWLTNHGELDRVKTAFATSIHSHRDDGSLDRYVQDFLSGTTSLTIKRKRSSSVARSAVSMVVGVIVCILVFRIMSLGVFAKTIIAALVMAPSAHLLAVAIAEEADQNRISQFDRLARQQLSLAVKAGTVERWVEEFAQ
jgi:hypothetical protein